MLLNVPVTAIPTPPPGSPEFFGYIAFALSIVLSLIMLASRGQRLLARFASSRREEAQLMAALDKQVREGRRDDFKDVVEQLRILVVSWSSRCTAAEQKVDMLEARRIQDRKECDAEIAALQKQLTNMREAITP